MSTTGRFKILKTIRRAPWRQHVNRRGGRYVVWVVFDLTEDREVVEFFTRRDAIAWISTNKK